MTLDELNDMVATAQAEADAAFAQLHIQALRDVTAIFTDMKQAIDDLGREVVADLGKRAALGGTTEV
jgi:hypothetical protein